MDEMIQMSWLEDLHFVKYPLQIMLSNAKVCSRIAYRPVSSEHIFLEEAGGGDQKDNHLRSYKFTMLVAADTDGLEHLAGDKDKRAALLLDKVL